MKETPVTEDQVMEALAKVPMFLQLDARNRRKLARLCTLKSFEDGDAVFEEGTMGLGLFIVTSGRVEIHKGSGGEKATLETVEAGGVLGAVALLDDRPRAASATAAEPTECLLLTRNSFETLVKKEPAIAWCLVPRLAGRVRDLQEQAAETELELDRLKREKGKTAAGAGKGEAEKKGAEAKEEASDDAGEDEAGVSDLESALFKVMRMQYGLMAGGAKGMTEMMKMMETFLESMAEETDLKATEDWRGLMESVPQAMATATRKAVNEGDQAAQAVVDAYRRYSEGKD